jgi:hypothetical protein
MDKDYYTDISLKGHLLSPLYALVSEQAYDKNDRYTRLDFTVKALCLLEKAREDYIIYASDVICNERNNPPKVVDNSQFVAEVFMKPSRDSVWVRWTWFFDGNGKIYFKES